MINQPITTTIPLTIGEERDVTRTNTIDENRKNEITIGRGGEIEKDRKKERRLIAALFLRSASYMERFYRI